MSVTVDMLVVWLIVGALAGSFVGMIVKRQREGFGRFVNLIVGLVGALIGGVLVNLIGIDLGLKRFSVTLEDLLAAVAGSLLLLIVVGLFRRAGRRRREAKLAMRGR